MIIGSCLVLLLLLEIYCSTSVDSLGQAIINSRRHIRNIRTVTAAIREVLQKILVACITGTASTTAALTATGSTGHITNT